MKRILNFLLTYKFVLLLLSLVLQIFVPVFFRKFYIQDLVSYAFISLTMLVSLLLFRGLKNHKTFVFYVVFAMLVFFMNWVDYFGEDITRIKIGRLLLLASLYVLIFIKIFKEFGNRAEVDLDFIFGAVSAYLILGILGSFTSVVIDNYYPGSFSFASAIPDFQDHLYYNFVTLTTLGYGDISPISPQGQMHAVAVALVGQLYLTITIALIVGRYLANAKTGD